MKAGLENLLPEVADGMSSRIASAVSSKKTLCELNAEHGPRIAREFYELWRKRPAVYFETDYMLWAAQMESLAIETAILFGTGSEKARTGVLAFGREENASGSITAERIK
jgi:hypothetical protein